MALWALGDAVPQVDPDAWVHPAAQLIGNVVVRAFANVWPGAVLRADFGSIDVGEGSSVQDNCVLHPGSQMPTQIGRDCIIGHAVHMEGALIEDSVLVGSGAVVLNGARVRTGGMVAAGALLVTNMEVLTGWRAQGVPATLVAHHGTPAQVRSGAETYRRLAHRYAGELRPVEAPR